MQPSLEPTDSEPNSTTAQPSKSVKNSRDAKSEDAVEDSDVRVAGQAVEGEVSEPGVTEKEVDKDGAAENEVNMDGVAVDEGGENEEDDNDAVDMEDDDIELGLEMSETLSRYIYATAEVAERLSRGDVRNRRDHRAAARRAIDAFDRSM